MPGDFNMDLRYHTPAEAMAFKAGRERGEISFFKTALCVRCGGEVLRGKLYCSKECIMKLWEVREIAEKLVGSEVELETKAGSIRMGRLTEVTWHEVKISGHLVKWPKGVILNGDKSDEIEWVQLNWIVSNAV